MDAPDFGESPGSRSSAAIACQAVREGAGDSKIHGARDDRCFACYDACVPTLSEQVHEVARRWDNGEYDEFRDVILDCRRLLGLAGVAASAELRTIVETVLRSSTTAYKEYIDQDPARRDTEGLIDDQFLF